MTEIIKKIENEEKISSEDYKNLLDHYQFNAKELAPGKIVRGKVIKITPTYVLVDVGFKSEGIIPIEDFNKNTDVNEIRTGDEVEALLERANLKEGYLILSRKKAVALKGLDNLERAYQHDGWVLGKITESIKNGFAVDVGISTFLPNSHADVRTVREPEKLIGNKYKFKVIKFDRRSENAVLSRKLFLQDEK